MAEGRSPRDAALAVGVDPVRFPAPPTPDAPPMVTTKASDLAPDEWAAFKADLSAGGPAHAEAQLQRRHELAATVERERQEQARVAAARSATHETDVRRMNPAEWAAYKARLLNGGGPSAA